jgi:hypothetical protein
VSSPDPAAYVLSACEARKGDSYEYPERSSTVVAVDKLVRERSATMGRHSNATTGRYP